MADKRQETAIAVIGTGPAGVAAATVLAQAGVDVVLLGPSPGEPLKAGESLPAAAIRLLRRLGIGSLSDLLEADQYLPCSANVSAWGEDHWRYRDAISDPEGNGWHLLRHCFDAALLDHAKAQGVRHLPIRVDDLASNGQQFQLKGDAQYIRSRYLIDATGRKAWAVRRLAGAPERRSEQFAAVAWLRSRDDDQDNTTRLKSVKDGWWYTARLPQGMRVLAFHGLPQHVGHLVKSPDAFLAAGSEAGVLPFDIAPSDLIAPLVGCDAGVSIAEAAAGPRWLAVGDAALAFDPLSSQGMFFALYSGIRGGETLIRIVDDSSRMKAEMTGYHQQVQDVFHANERTRSLFYAREPRYHQQAYWVQQRSGCFPATGKNAGDAVVY